MRWSEGVSGSMHARPGPGGSCSLPCCARRSFQNGMVFQGDAAERQCGAGGIGGLATGLCAFMRFRGTKCHGGRLESPPETEDP
jgi:hypothetical protein